MIKDIMHGHIGDKKENTLVAHLKKERKITPRFMLLCKCYTLQDCFYD